MEGSTAVRINVRGIVQGVGFRPFVYTLAMRNHLTGWVRNTSAGVEIEINGQPIEINSFYSDLKTNFPPLARIDHIDIHPIQTAPYPKFEILESQPNADDFIPVSPDRSICPDCQKELFDPANRRYRYPFINCTNCGPRFSIIKDIPYDRPKTTMANFPMCSQCQAEYDNPLDRRFHAQPTACPDCGPQIWFQVGSQSIAYREEALQTARHWLKQGKILAIKGLGGYHLACDASNPEAVIELRRRKKRSDKAFALMAFDLEAVKTHCHASAAEQAALLSNERPIVLLERRKGSRLAPEIAPGQKTLGFMLPYTPLHLLLLQPESGFPDALVMTSANLSEEPIAYQDEDAQQRLTPLADAFLMHNRPIHMRVDDSVIRINSGQRHIIRRARGFAPDPLRLPLEIESVLATGAELKNTFCLTRSNYAFLSHFIGDLENYETLQSFEEGIRHYERLFRITPQIIACDLHPNYLASRYARSRAQSENIPLVEVQHHHAHLAACLADNHRTVSNGDVIGVCLDGTGFGTDSAIWGGEFLTGGYRAYRRRLHLKYVPLPGGDAASRRPARMALAHLRAADIAWDLDLPPVQDLCAEERIALDSQLKLNINTLPTSSMGRLFDAASSLCGIRHTNTYEGQASIELEACVDPHETGFYPFDMQDDLIDPSPMWQALIENYRNRTPIPTLSARFHNSVAHMVVDSCKKIHQETGLKTVALSGGVWQNIYLFNHVQKWLASEGFNVLTHQETPTNDGCIALGQALIAAYSRMDLA